MKFLDKTMIHVRGGDGGSGCVSFARRANVRIARADGGSGGTGGGVSVRCKGNLDSLSNLLGCRHFRGGDGGRGKSDNKTGKRGEDVYIDVPIGTEISMRGSEHILADLLVEGETYNLVSGGSGGRGNATYKSASNRSPRQFGEGVEGREGWFILRMKILADAGLVGMPNSGKSTIVNSLGERVDSVVSEVGLYPFTTLSPHIRVVELDNYERYTLADLPGLIEGASAGRGLGHEFLAHIERCNVLIHVVDGSMADYLDNYRSIREELSSYSEDVGAKEEIIVINKLDKMTKEEQELRIAEIREESGSEGDIYIISALEGIGMEIFKGEIWDKISSTRETGK